ncbi:MAG: transaldolase [Lysobacterales bacterium]|jgi:transaldolase
MTNSNPLRGLSEHGQAVWLDNLSRTLISNGELHRLVDEDGVSGITSNPAIFSAAISEGDAYDQQIRELADRTGDTVSLYEALAIDDIRAAAELLLPVYERSGGTDGFVSLEVNPHLARDMDGTLNEAERLWHSVDRENVLIKIPGTPEGVPAIQEALYRGVNINITLLFSLEAYRAVMQAHLRALELRLKDGLPLDKIASVASFFLSRIDTQVDKRLDALGDQDAEATGSLRGKAAVSSAKSAYRMWRETYSGPRWAALEAAGAQVQKPLWASTSTKDPSYPDTKYVEPLIGPDTVNTMPEVTLDAFRDHGKVVPGSVEQGIEEALEVPARLSALGIDLEAVTEELVEEGITKFEQPFDALLKNLAEKRETLGG